MSHLSPKECGHRIDRENSHRELLLHRGTSVRHERIGRACETSGEKLPNPLFIEKGSEFPGLLGEAVLIGSVEHEEFSEAGIIACRQPLGEQR